LVFYLIVAKIQHLELFERTPRIQFIEIHNFIPRQAQLLDVILSKEMHSIDHSPEAPTVLVQLKHLVRQLNGCYSAREPPNEPKRAKNPSYIVPLKESQAVRKARQKKNQEKKEKKKKGKKSCQYHTNCLPESKDKTVRLIYVKSLGSVTIQELPTPSTLFTEAESTSSASTWAIFLTLYFALLACSSYSISFNASRQFKHEP
jgi:hypothetical protein